MRIGYDEALTAQPAALARSETRVRDQLRQQDPAPFASGRLGIVGMGASTNAARLLAGLLRRRGRAATAWSAGTLLEASAPAALGDAFVFLSESGDSTETVEVARRVGAARDTPRLAVTNAPDSALAREVLTHLDLACGPDSGVYTVGFTATLQAVALLDGWLAGRLTEVASADVPALDAALRQPEAAAFLGATARLLAGSRAVDIVGGGLHAAAAAQSALMLREGCRMPTACYPLREYLHGPMEWIEKGAAVIVFGEAREIELAHAARAAGASVFVLAGGRASLSEPSRTVGDMSLRIAGGVAAEDPSFGSAQAVLQESVIVQFLAAAIARQNGVPIGGFRYPQTDTKQDRLY